jgi:twitching motility protein PilI
MANREALRELQTRLASRLQAAKTEATSVSSWLAVESAGRFYLLPLGQSGEIFPWVAFQSVPYTQSWFLGVANLRGGLVGIVDLAGLVGANKSQRTEQALSDASLLAFNAALDVNAALLVDRLAGLRGTDAFVASEPPTEEAPAFFGTTYIDSSGARWQELNLQILSQHPAFLSISA